MSINKKILFYSVAAILGTYFLILGLSKAQSFLAPLTTAFILILLILPVAQKLEQKMKRVYSSLISTFLLFLFSLLFLGVVFLQMKTFVNDWSQVKETMAPKIEQLQSFITENTPLSKGDVYEPSDVLGGGGGDGEGESGGENSESSSNGKIVVSALGLTFSFLATYLLTIVYIFFLLNYRKRFKEFLLRLFPNEKKDEVKQAIHESIDVVQKYLIGKLMLIGLLAVLYSIGLGISGVSNFIIISLLAAFFTLVPYIGNLLGFALAVSFGFLSSGDTTVLIGIVITFAATQFIESYILEPYIIGDKVDVHPFFVIVGIVVGNAIWGVIGMILAIPILAIITVILLNVPPLKPFGFLFSNIPADE